MYDHTSMDALRLILKFKLAPQAGAYRIKIDATTWNFVQASDAAGRTGGGWRATP